MLAKGSRNKTVISLGSVSSGCSVDSAVPRSAVPQVSLTPDNVPKLCSQYLVQEDILFC